MITIESVEVWGFEHAIRGMRNPMNSWDKSDSTIKGKLVSIGKNNLDLMHRLYKAGTEHRKYLRQIFVSMDVTAPLYWWKEFDTYKIGTTANSCSTMHKIHDKPFTDDDFSHEHLTDESMNVLQTTIAMLNKYRLEYCLNKLPQYWWQMIQLLPSSYNQRRTVTMNYENVMVIINQRSEHKLDEWRTFVSELRKLPYVESIRGEEC